MASCALHADSAAIYTGFVLNKVIYKILTHDQWADLQNKGEIRGAPIDISDGYVHFSTAEQLQETADKHFSGQEGLFVLALNGDALGDRLKWEESRGGALFPHLYDVLKLDDVLWSERMELFEGKHRLPERIA